ncbi:MAG: four helix bundle protein [Calditrichaeota bacterium]|nr:MAG: four helix bundle protein [Calditrichota bacterium]
MKSFRDLKIWGKAILLVKEIYKLTNSFPTNEAYGLTQQIRRAVISIPSNIAEGYGRNSTQDYIRFLRISKGSLYEVIAQLEIAVALDYLESNDTISINMLCTELDKMIQSMINKILK